MNIFLPPLQGPTLAFYLLSEAWGIGPWVEIEDSYRQRLGIPSIFD